MTTTRDQYTCFYCGYESTSRFEFMRKLGERKLTCPKCRDSRIKVKEVEINKDVFGYNYRSNDGQDG